MNGMALLQKRALLQCLLCILLFFPLAASAESVIYQYDTRHRLIDVSYDSGKTFSYAYDGAENRLQQTVAAPNYSSNTPGTQAVGALLNMVSTGRHNQRQHYSEQLRPIERWKEQELYSQWIDSSSRYLFTERP